MKTKKHTVEVEIPMGILYCETCGYLLHTNRVNATNGTYYYCDNYRCPKSPKFLQYLLTKWKPRPALTVSLPSTTAEQIPLVRRKFKAAFDPVWKVRESRGEGTDEYVDWGKGQDYGRSGLVDCARLQRDKNRSHAKEMLGIVKGQWKSDDQGTLI